MLFLSNNSGKFYLNSNSLAKYLYANDWINISQKSLLKNLIFYLVNLIYICFNLSILQFVKEDNSEP